MLANNQQRWKIWESTGKTLDYNVFAVACVSVGVEPMPCMTFARLVGQALVGAATLPDLAPIEAYRRLPEESHVLDGVYIKREEVDVTKMIAATGCCGGGEVR